MMGISWKIYSAEKLGIKKNKHDIYKLYICQLLWIPKSTLWVENRFFFQDVKGQHFHYCPKKFFENGFKKITRKILTVQIATIM